MSLIFTKNQKEKVKKIWVKQAYNRKFISLEEENLLRKREQIDSATKKEIPDDQSDDEKEANMFFNSLAVLHKSEEGSAMNFNFYNPSLSFEENFFNLLKEDYTNGHEGFLLNELRSA